jgi:hypothetical protein
MPLQPMHGAALAAAALLLALASVGCSHTQPAAVRSGPTRATAVAVAASPSTILYVVRRAWHIDVGFAVDGLREPLSGFAAPFPGARFLMFGFGDRGYLHASHPWLPNMLSALWPGEGLILVTALQGSPQQAFGADQVVELRLADAALQAAQQRILTSMQWRDGRAESDGPGPYEGSEYLRASIRYSAIRTCNTWAAQVLQSAGLPVRTQGVVFAGQLWRQVRRLSGASDAPAPSGVPALQ